MGNFFEEKILHILSKMCQILSNRISCKQCSEPLAIIKLVKSYFCIRKINALFKSEGVIQKNLIFLQELFKFDSFQTCLRPLNKKFKFGGKNSMLINS